MSARSSSAAAWSTKLEPAPQTEKAVLRPDDPRLGEIIECWNGDEAAFQEGRPVLIGFPQDEGVRRNHGRAGAAAAPNEIRRWLHRLTPCDCSTGIDLRVQPPLDVGNLRITDDLEASQCMLGEIVGAILQRGAVPVVLGGGHETAYGHYLGYVAAGKQVAILNIDAHLDLRPMVDGQGHSGSPFRQALEHPSHPLPGECYVCIGAQPQYVSEEHVRYTRERGCIVRWCNNIAENLELCFRKELDCLAADRSIYVTIDADAARAADVPGTSAPNPMGLCGQKVIACARIAGLHPKVASFDLVEINPFYDRDHQSARWAALAVWSFLIGLAGRRSENRR
jgi:formiminoglutamase